MTVQLWRVVALVVSLCAAAWMGVGTVAGTGGPTSFVEEAQDAGVPGGVFARIDGGDVAEVSAFGDVTRTSRFLWGSVSKPVAATAAVRLAQIGRLDLDAPVARYVDGGPDVEVRHLLDHTSGLPFGAEWLDVDRPAAAALDVVGGLPASNPHPGGHAYSSLGYLYLQAVIERAAGRPYEEVVRTLLLGTNAGANAAQCADLASGHRLAGPWAWPIPAGYDGAGAAYGYTCGSIDDLATFAVRGLDGPSLPPGAPTGRVGETYSQGWRVTVERDGRVTRWHTGTVPGYFSAVYVDPATKDGVVVLLDASGYLHEEALASVTRNVYDRATGRPPRAVPSTQLGTWLPVGIMVLAVALGIVALPSRCVRGGRRSPWPWVGALVALVGVGFAGPLLAGYPHRYVWLWEPALVLSLLALAAALTLGTVCRLWPIRTAGASMSP